MTEITVKNKILGRYDYIRIWIDEEEYHLKYNSEIVFSTWKEEAKIYFSMFSMKSKNMIVKCSGKDKIFLELKPDIRVVIAAYLMAVLTAAFILWLCFLYNISNVMIIFGIFMLFFSFFSSLLIVKTVKLVEK